MTLLLDIGNTRVKWARLSGSRLIGAPPVTHRGVPPDAVLERLADAGRGATRALVASVGARELTASILEMLAERGLKTVVAASEPAALGVTNGYRVPAQLGVDRWLAVLAAWKGPGSAVCVADLGTALTVDLVNAQGHHLGGLIVPGPELMSGVLHESTGRIGEAAALAPAQPAGAAWGRDTATAIRLGALLALAGAIGRARDALGGQGPVPGLVMTGGAAERVLPHLPGPVEHRPQLVLEGLALRYAGVRVDSVGEGS